MEFLTALTGLLGAVSPLVQGIGQALGGYFNTLAENLNLQAEQIRQQSAIIKIAIICFVALVITVLVLLFR